jgi:16S rRNA (cytosine967-C5)-methyltransferase
MARLFFCTTLSNSTELSHSFIHVKRAQPESSSLIDQIIEIARSKPADAALRQVLARSHISNEDKRAISASVFRYFRWLPWLDNDRPLPVQLTQAKELQHRFNNHPESFDDAELLSKAVPAWAHDVMNVTIDFVRELQREPRLWLRAKPGTGRLIARELGDAIIPYPAVSDAIWYQGERDLYSTTQFHEGAFEIQDLSSQLVGLICAPTPGQTWWDACAGEGGKLLHLCDQMQNKGLVWATDPAEWRLKILKKRAGRAQLFNYRTKAWLNPGNLPVKGMFDGILVDAPCSGIGTWARNPHARWTTTRADIEKLAEIQRTLLDQVAPSVKSGGRLIYSVCTLAQAETWDTANAFSAKHPEFTPLNTVNPITPRSLSQGLELLPQEFHANGMFIYQWMKK